MPNHPVIPRPKVTITPVDDDYLVACEHCTWTYRAAVKVDANENARRHRAYHREGRIAVGADA